LALKERHLKSERVVITLVGCGRGPIALRILKAAENTNNNIMLYAIEKNYNTKSFLQMKFKK